ncbi:tms1 isoform f [Citrus sinensis]|uniref:Serine incorporator n=1 Tax=Citrus clementina TaxID=85681 RepID=V4RYU0_CITCL|nr:probable serine incorporator [Citrus x clementina]XP_006489289.1 uncharacterized protein LOC102626140 [Citrus sinensis]ESR33042.1 hypothetical protein CICLE_v10005070mg [Citrus x clementina]KAH9765303.1 tms1 isoform f [Citrus sinensis]
MSCLASCCASLTCGLCSSVASGISKKSARLAYCGLFGLSLIVSWILREVGTPLLEKFPWINTSDGDTRTKEWYQIQAVLRVSLGNFLFFGILSLIMIGIKDQNDKRDSWHHGGWCAKIIIWALLVVLMFFLPNVVISIYETISKFGAGLFLLVQVIILLDGVHTWNDAWVAKDEQKWYVALLAISVGCYLAAFTFSGILFIWFNPSGHDCGLNVFFIVMTMILAFVFAVIALNPSVNGSLLPASVISVYCAYVCYTALSSEPHDYVCNGLHNKSKAVTISTLVLGMLTTVLSVLYSALRAGSSTTFLSPPSSPKSAGKKPLLEGEDVEEGTENKKDIEGRPVSYSYSFFHLIFALASMYSAMLLSGWTSSSESSDLIDVGWTSVWVRICSQWVTAGLYIWTLVAPLLFPDREFF